jgi:hypothetical protein
VSHSGSTENSVDLDFDGHSVRILPSGAVSGFEGADGLCDSVRGLVHPGITFESEPASPFDLGHRGSSVSLDVSDLLSPVRADYQHPAPGVLVAECDRHHVRRPVFANRGECPEVPLGEELELGFCQVSMNARHGRRQYRRGCASGS